MVIVQVTTDNREAFREYRKLEPWFGTAPEALLQGFAQLPDLKVHVVSCTQRPMKSPEKLADNIWFHSLHVPKLGWLRTGYQGCVRAVRNKVRELAPDIVHGQGTERDCALGAVFSGRPNVLTVHGNMRLIARVEKSRPFSFQWLAARLEGFTLPRTDGVVCITGYTRAAVAPLARRTWLVPNAVDEKFFSLTPESGAEKVILCAGYISRRKNQNALIRALDPLAKEHRIRLVCAGVGDETDPYVAEFVALARQRPWVEYTGWLGRDQLREWYRRATVLALPSLEDNCPMAVLEAMAAGVPVMAARVGGVPELVEDGRTGLLCDPLDVPAITRSLQQLLEHGAFARELAVNARAHALQQFHPAAIARRHIGIYRELLDGGSKAHSSSVTT